MRLLHAGADLLGGGGARRDQGRRAEPCHRRPWRDSDRLPGETPHIETTLEAGALMTTDVTLPAPVGGAHIYHKVRDRASYAFALVSVGAVIQRDGSGRGGSAHRAAADLDIRTPPPGIPIATGRKRSGKRLRLLTVGIDCALGKKYTALALHRAFVAQGVVADFRATGQTGIMIAGGGIPMDAVISDFEAGAAKSPDIGT